MKTRFMPLCALALVAFWGCSQEESPVMPHSDFSGITQRDEWGDTLVINGELAVDSTDWVILGMINPASPPAEMPHYRDGIRLSSGMVQSAQDSQLVIGAFPNPFIPGAGQLLVHLNLPLSLDVEMHVEDESGELNLPLLEGTLSAGYYLVPWHGRDAAGAILPEGIYRIFFSAGIVTTFGDVEIVVASHPDPPGNTQYVLFAQENFDFGEYVGYEYQIASDFGWDGVSGGDDCYTLPQSSWELLNYQQKFLNLPVFMNYDLQSATAYQYHYLLAYKHFQFGAGWPDEGDSGIPDTTRAEWQKANTYHNDYVEFFESGP